MTAKSSISSTQRPRDFMAGALRSMWGPDKGARPATDDRTAGAASTAPADGKESS